MRTTTFPGLTTAETELLKRKTITPLLDFVVIPLDISTVDQILERILSDPCLMDAVVHIEIAKTGRSSSPRTTILARPSAGQPCRAACWTAWCSLAW